MEFNWKLLQETDSKHPLYPLPCLEIQLWPEPESFYGVVCPDFPFPFPTDADVCVGTSQNAAGGGAACARAVGNPGIS